jgi:hypothetical protein
VGAGIRTNRRSLLIRHHRSGSSVQKRLNSSGTLRRLCLSNTAHFGSRARAQISLSLSSAFRIAAGVAGFPTITLGPSAETILETVASSEA